MAKNFLYKFRGRVIKGKDRGTRLGFPTANTKLKKEIPEGIYLSVAKIGEDEFNSLTFIGASKTFNDSEILAETFILDFNKNLEGKSLSVELLRKIRDNKKFQTENDLITQLKEDEKLAREFFKTLT